MEARVTGNRMMTGLCKGSFSFCGELFFLALFCGLLGCNSTTAPDFIKTTGNQSTSTRLATEPIMVLEVGDRIDIVLRADTSPTLLLRGGANLLPKLRTEQSGGTLRISDGNEARFMRSYGPRLSVEVPAGHLRLINHSGFGQMRCADTLRLPKLELVQGGAADIVLLFAGGQLAANQDGQGSLTLAGRAAYAYVSTGKVNRLDARHFLPRYLEFSHSSIQPIALAAQDSLVGTIANRGNVVLAPRPDGGRPGIRIVATGKGKLVLE